MNNKFEKILKGNYYYFKDISNNKKIKLEKSKLLEEGVYSCDVLRITEDLDYNFISYILKELIETKDLLVVEVLFEDKEILEILEKNNLKISNYNYEIPFKKYNIEEYNVSDKLDDASKKYFLENMNSVGRRNQLYINPNKKYHEITEKWFEIEDYQFLTYKRKDKIVGMVDFKIFEEYEVTDNLYDYSNSICIRTVFAENEETLANILKDLMNKYQKRIIISHLFTDSLLETAIKNLNGTLKYLYVINQNLNA